MNLWVRPASLAFSYIFPLFFSLFNRLLLVSRQRRSAQSSPYAQQKERNTNLPELKVLCILRTRMKLAGRGAYGANVGLNANDQTTDQIDAAKDQVIPDARICGSPPITVTD